MEGFVTALSKEISRYFEGHPDKEHLPLVYAAINDNLKNVNAQMNKRLLAILITCAAFELVSRSAIDSISLFGLDVKELTVVQRLIPMLVSYLYFSCVGWFALGVLLQDAHKATIASMFPGLKLVDVETYLRPSADVMLFGLVHGEASGRIQMLIGLSFIPVVMVIFLAPPIFVIYAAASLLAEFGFSDVLTSGSVALSLLFLIQGALLLSGAFRSHGAA